MLIPPDDAGLRGQRPRVIRPHGYHTGAGCGGYLVQAMRQKSQDYFYHLGGQPNALRCLPHEPYEGVGATPGVHIIQVPTRCLFAITLNHASQP